MVGVETTKLLDNSFFGQTCLLYLFIGLETKLNMHSFLRVYAHAHWTKREARKNERWGKPWEEPGRQRHRSELTSPRCAKIPSEIQELQNRESSPQYFYIQSIFLVIMINHEKIVYRYHGFPGDLDHSLFRPRLKSSYRPSFLLRDKLIFSLITTFKYTWSQKAHTDEALHSYKYRHVKQVVCSIHSW